MLLTRKAPGQTRQTKTPMIFRAVAACPSCFRKKETPLTSNSGTDEVTWTVSAMFGTA